MGYSNKEERLKKCDILGGGQGKVHSKTKEDSVRTFWGLWVGVCFSSLLWMAISARLKASEERLP